MQPQQTILLDDEVASTVLGIVRDAAKFVTIVTPYIDLWGHAKDALRLAVQRGVKVTLILRDDPKDIRWEDVAWLQENGVHTMVAERLHAKIYLNERSVVVSSMNLTVFSTQNSLELAVTLGDPNAEKRVRDYVTRRLVHLAKPLKPTETAQSTERPAPSVIPREPPAPYRTKSRSKRPSGLAAAGHCIRCGRQLALDPTKPLCAGCYDSWAEWENVDYPEKFCHVCARPATTTYAQPLCGSCYWQRASRR